ncbi:hypothetical protein [Pyrococcus sp. ST04]|uniref:hypothetical protein n=1 Tax=Pyrococcus sp. ST04 TaxID=1183377 RepID=UPI0002605B6A|nr:hypothetical protein [Pyrococcus sp. ST04]AFK22273.1 hypothetical protein Py04_0671 [Pyrococcus sp. ST04]
MLPKLPILILAISVFLIILVTWNSKESFYLTIISLVYILIAPTRYYGATVLLPSVFLLAPRFCREAGFLIVGLILISETVRESLSIFSALKLSAFSLILALLLLSPPRRKIIREGWALILSLLSALLSIAIPVLPILIPAYILAFPVTTFSYMYAFFFASALLPLHELGLYSFPKIVPLDVFDLKYLIIQVVIIGYVLFKERLSGVIRRKQTLMLLLLSIFSLPFAGKFFQEFVLVISAASVRLLVTLPHHEET